MQVNDFVKNDRPLFGIFGKKFNKSVTIRKKIVTIKQLIELNKVLNYKMKSLFLNQNMKNLGLLLETSTVFSSVGKGYK